MVDNEQSTDHTDNGHNSMHKCSQCDKGCRTADQLRSHILREHPVTNGGSLVETEEKGNLLVKNADRTKTHAVSTPVLVTDTIKKNARVVLKRIPEKILKKYMNRQSRQQCYTQIRRNVRRKENDTAVASGKTSKADRKRFTCSMEKVAALNEKKRNSYDCTCNLNVGAAVVLVKRFTPPPERAVPEAQLSHTINRQNTDSGGSVAQIS